MFWLFFNMPITSQVHITGKVIDQISDVPIGMAVVKIEGTNKISLSDDSGMFSISVVEGKESIIEISRVGYLTKHQSITARGRDSLGLVIHLSQSVIETGTVIVTGEHQDHTGNSMNELSLVLHGKELEKELGNTLAATLKNEAGIALRTMGPAPARPVIRGLSGDRVQIMEDGFISNDMSATSPDHAVSIESINAEKIEIIRGPKVLLTNASAIGGIVNVVKNEIPISKIPHILGTIGLFGETANRGFAGAGNLSLPLNALCLNIEGSKRETGNLSTPLGYIKNSGMKTYSYSTGLGYFSDNWRFGSSFKEYNSDYGVPGGFVGAHPNGVDISMFKRDIAFLAVFNTGSKNIPEITGKFNRDYYRHQEFENAGIIGAEFTIFTYAPTISVKTSNLWLFTEGEVQGSYDYRDFKIGGFVFSPPVISNKSALSVYQKAQFANMELEIALRSEHASMAPQATSRATKAGYIVQREFQTFSGSLALSYVISEVFSAGTALSRYSRIPTIEELYSEGPHLAAYSYEIGKPTLSAEFGYSFEGYLKMDFDNVNAGITLFNYSIPYYIVPRNSGRINYATLLPVYETAGVGAVLRGFETSISTKVSESISVNNNMSFTYGYFTQNQSPLPGIAPFKTSLEINSRKESINYGIHFEYNADQKRVDT
ncbi:MAG: TonB-dependent receptor, partial [Ignavibacteriales bacterium]|nr:TonB-dependent receptor [Ignavibacteriales bacterium]